MNNRSAFIRLPDIRDTGHRSPSNHAALQRFRRIFSTGINWLRAGYPDEAPRTGHSPLVALYGPLALTTAQKDRIADALAGHPAGTTDIEVAITRATNRLPSPAQTEAIITALHHRFSQQ